MTDEIKRLFNNLELFLECDYLKEEIEVWKSEDLEDINSLKDLNNMMEDELSYIKMNAIEDMPK